MYGEVSRKVSLIKHTKVLRLKKGTPGWITKVPACLPLREGETRRGDANRLLLNGDGENREGDRRTMAEGRLEME